MWGQARRCSLSKHLLISIAFPGYPLPPQQVTEATPTCSQLGTETQSWHTAHRQPNSVTQANGVVKCTRKGK